MCVHVKVVVVVVVGVKSTVARLGIGVGAEMMNEQRSL